jgi:membrane-associated phospholipid phosphatase
VTPRSLGASAGVLAVLAALSIAVLDVPIARAVAELPPDVHAFFRAATEWFDLLSTKELANSAIGLALFAVAFVAWLRSAARPLARVLVLVALCNLVAHLVTGLLKPVFGRLRPFDIEGSGWIDRFFAGGGSFPSGHTAYYMGLCVPLAWAFPRWRIPLLLPGLFVAAARVLVNDHFAGDVLGSLAITSLVCAIAIAVMQRFAKLERLGSPGPRPAPDPAPRPST